MCNFTSGVGFNQPNGLARSMSQPATGDPIARALVLRPTLGMLRLTGLLLGLPHRRQQVM